MKSHFFYFIYKIVLRGESARTRKSDVQVQSGAGAGVVALYVLRGRAPFVLGLGVLLVLAQPAAPYAPHPAPPSTDTPPPENTVHCDISSPPSQAPFTSYVPQKLSATTAPPAPLAAGAVYVRDLWVPGHSQPHPELCPALGARLRLLILVSSAPHHAKARDGVRLTWGYARVRADVAFAFVVGAAPGILEPTLAAEDDLYGDLIRTRSLDSYNNLTLKTLSILEWVDAYCPLAPMLLKVDDDVFLNVVELLKFVSDPGNVNATRTVWGRVARKWRPERNTKSKYYVPLYQFSGSVYPDFVTGPAYLMTRDCVGPLLAAALHEVYFKLEDVFVTGVLPPKLGITIEHAPGFYNRKIAPEPCAIRRGISVHMVPYHEKFYFWQKLFDEASNCSASKYSRWSREV